MTRAPVKTEARIERALIGRVAACGGIAVKTTVLGSRGFPDRILFLPNGRVVVVELKRPKGGRLSAQQRIWLERLRGLGVEVAIVCTAEEVEALLACPPKLPNNQ